MSILDRYGHPSADMFENPRFYLLRGTRIALAADNQWRAALEDIGAVEVDRETYERADATRKGGEA